MSLPEELATLVLEMERDYMPREYRAAPMTTVDLLEMLYKDGDKLDTVGESEMGSAPVQDDAMVKVNLEDRRDKWKGSVAATEGCLLPLDLTLAKKSPERIGIQEDGPPPIPTSVVPGQLPRMEEAQHNSHGRPISFHSGLQIEVVDLEEEEEQTRLMKTNAGLHQEKLESHHQNRDLAPNQGRMNAEVTLTVRRFGEKAKVITVQRCLHDDEKLAGRKAPLPNPIVLMKRMDSLIEDAAANRKLEERDQSLDHNSTKVMEWLSSSKAEVQQKSDSKKRKLTPQEKAAEREVNVMPRKRGRPRKRPLRTGGVVPKPEASVAAAAAADEDDHLDSSDNESLFQPIMIQLRPSYVKMGNRKLDSRRG